MTKYFSLSLSLSLSIVCLHAQENMVSNSSFEKFVICPTDKGQISRASNWDSATNGTPDYYNACSSDPLSPTSLPTHSQYFTKHPRTGDAIVGIHTNFFPSHNDNKEYITSPLKNKLEPKKLYFVEFYVSPKDSVPNFSIPCFIDKLGVSLSIDFEKTTLTAGQTLRKLLYVGNEDKILDNTKEWTRITGCVSGNGEKYLTIGSFFTNEETLIRPDCSNSFFNNAYYYIDDVGVYEFDIVPDTLVLCDGEIATLGKSFLDANYLWNTSSQDSTIIVDKAGLYVVNVEVAGCTLSDTTIVVDENAITSFFPTDTTICTDRELTLQMPHYSTYKWSTGATGTQVTIADAGTYTLEIENKCGNWMQGFVLDIEECDCLILSPNIFSPNGDNINDEIVFHIDCQFNYIVNSLKVFDRWGNMVHSTSSSSEKLVIWNGKHNGVPVKAGVYVWVLEYTYSENDNDITTTKVGDVTVIR